MPRLRRWVFVMVAGLPFAGQPKRKRPRASSYKTGGPGNARGGAHALAGALTLLHVGDLAVDEGDFQIFVDVDLLGAEVDDFFRGTEAGGHLVDGLAQLDGSRGRGGLLRRLLLRLLGLLLIAALLLLLLALIRVRVWRSQNLADYFGDLADVGAAFNVALGKLEGDRTFVAGGVAAIAGITFGKVDDYFFVFDVNGNLVRAPDWKVA